MNKDSYNTDGMCNMPVINTNCLESIKMAIAFDVRDWSEDRRSAWIYGIIFGWDDAIEEVKTKFRWTNEDVERLNRYHNEWGRLLKQLADRCKYWKKEVNADADSN